MNTWQRVVCFASFEWMLGPKRPNGGAVILGRAIGVALLLTILTLLLQNWIDPTRTDSLSLKELRIQLVAIAPWFAGAVGAVYAALYARFSAQWSYLAVLYNQIKQSELEMNCSSTPPPPAALEKLNEWKAGFIEDAEDLHLHTKSNVATVIYHWGKDVNVEKLFIAAAPGGLARWKSVYAQAILASENVGKKY